MKLSYNGIDLTGDIPEEQPDNYRLNGAKLVQEVALIDAAQIALYDRGNHRFTHAFRICRTWGNAGLAELYLAKHQKACLAASGVLVSVYRDPRTNITVGSATWQVAQISQIGGVADGCATAIDYSIITGIPAFQT